ncbi:hypothetical protein P7C70_g6842, partial [Phenoliferia sp. Uapishka_3]
MSLKITPFKVHFADEQLDKLRTQVKAAHIPRPTYEASGTSDRNLGVTREWLLKVKAHWEDGFDWLDCFVSSFGHTLAHLCLDVRRAQEARCEPTCLGHGYQKCSRSFNTDSINEVKQFVALIPQPTGDPFELHFIHERSTNPNAKTILFLHGWPGSFLEFIEAVKILREAGDYNIVVPSAPGYMFSDPPPVDRDYGLRDVAALMNDLMIGLGYEKYGVQAGDWGSAVARIMGVRYDTVHCVHLNLVVLPGPPAGHSFEALSSSDKKMVEKTRKWAETGRGYAIMHATKPATVGFVVASSPIAHLCWVGEKFLDWTDQDPSIDEILTSVTAQYLTDTYPTSIYTYRERSVGLHGEPEWFIKKPTGFSFFPEEIVQTPASWIGTTCNLVWTKEHSKGGHFAAMEQPELLAADVREFFDQAW